MALTLAFITVVTGGAFIPSLYFAGYELVKLIRENHDFNQRIESIAHSAARTLDLTRSSRTSGSGRQRGDESSYSSSSSSSSSPYTSRGRPRVRA